MARYRIKQRPSYTNPGNAIFETEERVLLWWEYRAMHFSIEEAERHVADMKETHPVRTKIIKQYD